jgi:serine/threonine-protein kinase
VRFSDSGAGTDTGDEDDLLKAIARAPPQTPGPTLGAAGARVGTVLVGKYTLDAVLGVGGMAVVYKATHRNGAKLAIKMLLPQHASDEDIRRRFRREARYANMVDHPGALSVIDDDVSDDGVGFLVLELLQGAPCDQLCAKHGGRLPIEAACATALQVLDVLEAAHAKGIFHRDIKPSNLFVLRDGTVKVLDFGIARLRQSVAGGAHSTQTGGTLLGTPAFMAPEQADATSELDERVDIWGVGATLFNLLSGATVTRPARSLGSVTREVPDPRVDVVDKALRYDPADRWPSASAMRIALLAAYRRAFNGSPGPVALASLLRSDFASEPPDATSSTPPTVRSGGEAPAPATQRPWRVRLWWLACAAALLAAGLFAALLANRPQSVASLTPPAQEELAAITVPAVSEEPAPYVPLAVRSREPIAPAAMTGDALPRSCANARAAGVSSDGPVWIDPDGTGPIRAFEVFCAGMSGGAGEPREYLTLSHGDSSGEPEANATRYVYRGGACDCPDLVRHFARVRLDPRRMAIDPTDGTFATYSRPLTCEAQHRSQCGEGIELAWGAPGSCRAAGDTSGSASIDLRGTPFALAPKVRFVPAGFGAAGKATVSKKRKTATLAGGGLCGSLVSEEPVIPVTQER